MLYPIYIALAVSFDVHHDNENYCPDVINHRSYSRTDLFFNLLCGSCLSTITSV